MHSYGDALSLRTQAAVAAYISGNWGSQLRSLSRCSGHTSSPHSTVKDSFLGPFSCKASSKGEKARALLAQLTEQAQAEPRLARRP